MESDLEKYKKLMRQRREASTRHYNKKWKVDLNSMSVDERKAFEIQKKARSAKQLAYYYTKKAESLKA